MLTNQHKRQRLETCQHLLQRFSGKRDDFLKHIVTCNEA